MSRLKDFLLRLDTPVETGRTCACGAVMVRRFGWVGFRVYCPLCTPLYPRRPFFKYLFDMGHDTGNACGCGGRILETRDWTGILRYCERCRRLS